MRLSLRLAPPLLLACLAASAGARTPFLLPSRAGLHGTAGFQEGADQLVTLTGSGWACGHSLVEGRQAAWVLSPADGVSRRVGLYADPYGDFRARVLGVTGNGLAWGTSDFVNSPPGAGTSSPGWRTAPPGPAAARDW